MSDYKVKHDNDHGHGDVHDIGEDLGMTTIWGVSVSFFFLCIAATAWLIGIYGKANIAENEVKLYHSYNMTLDSVRNSQLGQLNEFRVVDAQQGRVTVSIDEAKRKAIRTLIGEQRNPPPATMLINGTETNPYNPCNPGATTAAANPCNPCSGTDNPCAKDPAEGEPGTAHGVATE